MPQPVDSDTGAEETVTIAGGQIKLGKSKLTYNGKEQTVDVAVYNAAGERMPEDSYVLSGNRMKKPGTQRVSVTDRQGNQLSAVLKMVPKKPGLVSIRDLNGSKVQASKVIKAVSGKTVKLRVRAYSSGGWSKWSVWRTFLKTTGAKIKK